MPRGIPGSADTQRLCLTGSGAGSDTQAKPWSPGHDVQGLAAGLGTGSCLLSLGQAGLSSLSWD